MPAKFISQATWPRIVALVGMGAFCTLIVTSKSDALAAPGAPSASPRVYKGCPPDKVWSEEKTGCVCAPGYSWKIEAKGCVADPPPCPPGQARDPRGNPTACVDAARICVPGKQFSETHNACVVSCPAGKIADAKGTGCVVDAGKGAAPPPSPPPQQQAPQQQQAPNKQPEYARCPDGKSWSDAANACTLICPSGKVLDAKGTTCVTIAKNTCPANKQWSDDFNGCVPICPARKELDAKGVSCVSKSKQCPDGREWKDAFDACVPICPPDQVLDFKGASCHPIRVERKRNTN